MKKGTETMLAIWPNAKLDQYVNRSEDCNSIWLDLRCYRHTDSYDPEGKNPGLETSGDKALIARNVGVWIWCNWMMTKGSCDVEFKGHEIYSANLHELKTTCKGLEKLQKQQAKVQLPDDMGVKTKLILTLQAIGVVNAIIMGSDVGQRYIIMPVMQALDTYMAYWKPLDYLETLREGKHK